MRLPCLFVFLTVGAAAFHPPPCGHPLGTFSLPSAACRAPTGARFLAAFRQFEDGTDRVEETAPLSVDEMMQAVQAQFGDDVENEEELRAAFEAALREDARPPPPGTTAGAPGAPGAPGVQVELKSGLLRGAASLVFELRSFAQGAREDLEVLQSKAVEKATLDARLTVRAADWFVRRAILDSGRVLGAVGVSLALGGAPVAEQQGEERAAAGEAGTEGDDLI